MFTGTFIHTDFLGLIFSLVSYIPQACMEERQLGTTHYVLRFFLLTTFINLLFSVSAVGIGYSMAPSVMFEPSMGLWPILFCELVISCMQNPDMPRGLCCLPINIPSRWYPLVLIALFTIFFGLQFCLLTGLGAGYMYAMGCLRPLEFSQASINAWEKRWPFSRMSRSDSFQGTQSN